MKHKTFLFLFLLILSLSIEAFSQGTQEKGWVRLSFSFPKDIPIYDIKVNTREASSTDQYIIATFTDGKNEVLLNSGTSRGFWSLNLSLTWSCFVNKDGKNQKVKLEKPKDKNDNYHYLNLAKHKIGPLRLKEIQKNFLAENVYVLIEKNGYYYLINNQYYLALSYFKKKAQEGDLNSMDIYADLLLKYGNYY